MKNLGTLYRYELKKLLKRSQRVFVCMIESSKKQDKDRLYNLYRNCEDEFDPEKPSYWDS